MGGGVYHPEQQNIHKLITYTQKVDKWLNTYILNALMMLVT